MRHAAVLLVLVGSILAAPLHVSAGQAASDPPRVELGLDASVGGAGGCCGGTRGALGPRITFNLSPETALTLVGDAWTRTRGRTDASLYAVELRRGIRDRFSWMLGGGVSRRRDFQPGYSYKGVTYPAETRTQNNGAVTIGLGFDQRVASRLSLRQDFRIIFAGEGSEARAQFGIGLPIGRYTIGAVPRSRVFGTETIRTGHRVWITDANGTEINGRVGDFGEDSVEVVTRSGRTIVQVADIQRLERPDGLGNGTKLGAAIGAGTTAVLMAVMAASFGTDDGAAVIVGMMGGAAYGAGLGALFGAVVDGLTPGRRTVFERSPNATNVTVAPFVSANARAAGAVVSW